MVYVAVRQMAVSVQIGNHPRQSYFLVASGTDVTGYRMFFVWVLARIFEDIFFSGSHRHTGNTVSVHCT